MLVHSWNCLTARTAVTGKLNFIPSPSWPDNDLSVEASLLQPPPRAHKQWLGLIEPSGGPDTARGPYV